MHSLPAYQTITESFYTFHCSYLYIVLGKAASNETYDLDKNVRGEKIIRNMINAYFLIIDDKLKTNGFAHFYRNCHRYSPTVSGIDWKTKSDVK